MNRFGSLFYSFSYYNQENKLSLTKNLLTDILFQYQTNSTYSSTGMFENIHPSTTGVTEYIVDTGTIWSMDTFYNIAQRLCLTSADNMYWFETGSTLNFSEDGMCCYNRISANLVGDFDLWTMLDSNIWAENNILYKTGETTSYATFDIGSDATKTFEINFKFKSTRLDDGDFIYLYFGSTTSPDIYYRCYGTSNQTVYINGSGSYSEIFLYFQDKMQGQFDWIEVYEVEKARIDSCFINHLQDNIFFPSDTASLQVQVSADGGANWENYDYTTDKNHDFINRGTDFQIKFVGTGDKTSGPAYIRSQYKLDVELYNSVQNRILRVDNKIVRIDGKIARI